MLPTRAVESVLVLIALAAQFLAVSALPLTAHPAAQESMSFSVEGKITQHAGNKLTVNTEGNIIFRVVYSDKTSVTRKDGSAGTSKDLLVGTRIHVDGELTESGEIIAGKITVLAEVTEKKP